MSSLLWKSGALLRLQPLDSAHSKRLALTELTCDSATSLSRPRPFHQSLEFIGHFADHRMDLNAEPCVPAVASALAVRVRSPAFGWWHQGVAGQVRVVAVGR